MSLNLDRIRQRQKETATRGGGAYLKCQEGKNTIRVFTFNHKVTKEDMTAGYFPKDKIGKVVTELDRPVTRFFEGKGRPILSAGKDDPRMDAYNKAMAKAGSDRSKQEEARKLAPRTSYFLNVVNTSSQEPKMLEYAAPKTVYCAILDYVLDPEYGEEILGCEGRDFVIMFDKNKKGSDMYQVKLRDADKCEELLDSLESQVKDYYDPEVLETLGDSPDAVRDMEDDTADKEVDDETDDKDLEDEEDEPKSKKKR